MKKLNCPYCNAGLTVPEDYAGNDVTCPACGQSFFLEGDAPGAEPGAGAPPPPPRKPPRAPQAAFMQRGPGGTIKKPEPPTNTTVKESRAKVGNWFIGLGVLAAVLIILGDFETEVGRGLMFIGSLIASISFTVELALILSYLRTIALNSERR